MAITNAAFIAALQAMTVTGVTLHEDEPPSAVNTDGLPLAFPALPRGERGEPVTSCVADSKTRRMEYVILISPRAQGTNASNYDQLAALMDNLEAAFDALEIPAGGSLANFIQYQIGVSADFQVGNSAWWAIVADVGVKDTPL